MSIGRANVITGRVYKTLRLWVISQGRKAVMQRGKIGDVNLGGRNVSLGAVSACSGIFIRWTYYGEDENASVNKYSVKRRKMIRQVICLPCTSIECLFMFSFSVSSSGIDGCTSGCRQASKSESKSCLSFSSAGVW